MTTITEITIIEGACAWGPGEMAAAEREARQRIYEERAAAALATAYPGVDITHDIDLCTYAHTRIAADITPGDDGVPLITGHHIADHVTAILGQAWQDACEAEL